MIKITKTTEVNIKRITEIENFIFSIYGLVNPNMKEMAKRNPIAVNSTIAVLETLREELKVVSINSEEINLDAIFGQLEGTTTDEFIKINTNACYHFKDYKSMLEYKEIDKIYPLAERNRRVKELEIAIVKNDKFIDMFSSNKALCKSREDSNKDSRRELEQFKAIQEAPTEQYIINILYGLAIDKVNYLISSVEENMQYLKELI